MRSARRPSRTNNRPARARAGLRRHPYELDTDRAQPPEGARERIAKAERLTTQLLATITFFFATLQAKVEALGLAPEIETLVHQQLIPAIDLERLDADLRRAIEHERGATFLRLAAGADVRVLAGRSRPAPATSTKTTPTAAPRLPRTDGGVAGAAGTIDQGRFSQVGR